MMVREKSGTVVERQIRRVEALMSLEGREGILLKRADVFWGSGRIKMERRWCGEEALMKLRRADAMERRWWRGRTTTFFSLIYGGSVNSFSNF